MKHIEDTLQNGISVLSIPQESTDATTILVLVKAGSRLEDDKNNGISHFIEHLLFKGTKKYPNTTILSRTLDAVGADFNAYTSKDHTGYYIKLQSEKLELALSVLSDMVYHPLFDSEEIERERGVILEEINMYEDNPMMSATDVFEGLLYGEKTALGQDIIGTKDTIKNMSRDQILEYKNEWYRPDTIEIVLSGKLPKEEELTKLLNTHFVQKGLTEERKEDTSRMDMQQTEPRVAIKKKETEQVHLVLGLPAYHYTHEDRLPLAVANKILGGGMSSRLFINIRERQGLCYYIRSAFDPYTDAGGWYVRAGLDKNRIDEAITRILEEFKKLKDKGVTNEELQEAKDGVRGSMIVQLEDSLAVADFYGKRKLLTGEIISPEEALAKIDAVTHEDIERVVKDLLVSEKLNLAVVGSFDDEERFKKLLTF